MKISPANRIAYPLLAAVVVAAVLIEQGVADGLWILGGIAYASSLLMVIGALLSSIALRKLTVDRLEYGLAFFAAGFAIVVLLFARSWFPLTFISSIAIVAAVVIWTVTSFAHRRSAQ